MVVLIIQTQVMLLYLIVEMLLSTNQIFAGMIKKDYRNMFAKMENIKETILLIVRVWVVIMVVTVINVVHSPYDKLQY